jgi:hypothetical protein
MRQNPSNIAGGGWLAIVLMTLVVGCSNTVEPFSPTTRHYAIYGFLDANADTQYVRIEATRPNPEQEDQTREDLPTVSLTNVTTNEVVFWQDSTVVLEDGSEALLFWVAYQPEAGQTYRFEVKRSDGAVSSATTRVPDFDQLEVKLPSRTSIGTYEQAVIFDNVSRRPEKITLNYEIAYEPEDDPFPITLDYNVFGVPVQDGWQINVRLTRDRERINSRLSIPPSRVLLLHDVSMSIRLLSSDWPLVESRERVVNVENGFGFFGAAATHQIGWQLDSLVVTELGFEDVQSIGENRGN